METFLMTLAAHAGVLMLVGAVLGVAMHATGGDAALRRRWPRAWAAWVAFREVAPTLAAAALHVAAVFNKPLLDRLVAAAEASERELGVKK